MTLTVCIHTMNQLEKSHLKQQSRTAKLAAPKHPNHALLSVEYDRRYLKSSRRKSSKRITAA